MSLKKLTVIVVLFELVALGVFFAALLGLQAARGGIWLTDMTQYGEQWVEFWIMMALMAVAPYALYSIEEIKVRGE